MSLDNQDRASTAEATQSNHGTDPSTELSPLTRPASPTISRHIGLTPVIEQNLSSNVNNPGATNTKESYSTGQTTTGVLSTTPLTDRDDHNIHLIAGNDTNTSPTISPRLPRSPPHRIWEEDSRRIRPILNPSFDFSASSMGHESTSDLDVYSPSPPRALFNDDQSSAQQRTGVSEVSSATRNTRQIAPLTIPSPPVLPMQSLPGQPSSQWSGYPLSSSTPSTTSSITYKRRIRKAVTKELAPDDISGLVALGMAPFMIGQDAMTNQNRLVRNESILTQHLVRLQRSMKESESVHAQREEDIYRILADHSASLGGLSTDSPTGRMGSVRSDPEFIALSETLTELRKELNEARAHVAASAEATKLSMKMLAERIDQLSASPNQPPPSTPASSQTSGHLSPLLFSSTPNPFSIENSRKRKYDLDLTMSPPRDIARLRQSSYPPRRTWPPANDTSMDVIYGPISNATGSSGSREDGFMHPAYNLRAIANEAVHDVGMNPRAIRSVRPAHGNPDFISIRFLKYEYAIKFVEQVSFGHDGHSGRSATLADFVAVDAGSSAVASSSKSTL